MTPPLITVIMATCRHTYLAEAVHSVLKQTFTDFEFLVGVDGGGSKCCQTLENISAKDPRLKWIKTEPIGVSRISNLLLQQALGKYIARMDDDDICLPNRFSVQLNYMETHPETDILGSSIYTLRDTKKGTYHFPQTDGDIRAQLFAGSPIAHSTSFIRKRVFAKLCYAPQYIVAHDYKLWVDAMPDFTFHNLPEPLLTYRHHGEQISQSPNSETARREADSIRKDLLLRVFPNANQSDCDLAAILWLREQITNRAQIERLATLVNTLASENKHRNIFPQENFENLLSHHFLTCVRSAVRAGRCSSIDYIKYRPQAGDRRWRQYCAIAVTQLLNRGIVKSIRGRS